MFELKPDFEEVLNRYEAWWDCDIVDRPLVSMAFPVPLSKRKGVPQKEYVTIRERWMDTAHIVAQAEARLRNTVHFADSLPIAWPNLGPEVFSAFYGCEMEYGEGTAWSKPVLADWSDESIDKLQLDRHSFYFRKLIDAVNSRTRLVAISSVQFASGFRTDLATLGEHCTSKGVLLCVDAIQSLGAMPIDVKAMNIDFLSADGHKWLCGPEGLGIFYVRKELQGHLRPSCVGWLSMKNWSDFSHYQFEFRDDIRRYDSGAYNLAGIYALGGAIDLLLEIGLRDKGYRIYSSRRPTEASGIVSFYSDVHDHEAVQRHLRSEHRIVIAARGGRLRASPHVYNSEKEIDRLIEVLPRH